ncbi:aminoglycoside phosphotransferase family protein [Streptomyces sp. NPDC002262]|uniref:phosphotransferase family protein n=1 Tax=Streptomyces sp. NPDC002262 TaxID=3154414 RepID=UPI00331EC64A
MTTSDIELSRTVLAEAVAARGFSARGATLIRLGENALWRLASNVVVRIARPGQDEAAAREVAVARWLASAGVPTVEPLEIDQPVIASGRAATFWKLLPPHKAGTEADLAGLLAQLHSLPLPTFPINRLDPFVRIEERLAASHAVAEEDRAWLLNRLRELIARWRDLPGGRGDCVVHGDAWTGNCAVVKTPTRRAVLLDYERTSIGPPEWDLTSTAIEVDTFGNLSTDRYRAYCDQYGYDVMDWPGYPTLRAIRELRLVTFALQIADSDPTVRSEAQGRIDCLRGRRGPRPWGWSAVG